MSTTNSPKTIFLQFSGNYNESRLETWGMPFPYGLNFSELSSSSAQWTAQRLKIINFLKAKLEIFNINISIAGQNNPLTPNVLAKIIFLPVKSNSGDTSVLNFYTRLKQKLNITSGFYAPLNAIAFPTIRTGFVFLVDKDPFDSSHSLYISDSHHHAAALISKILGIKSLDFGYKNGAPSKRAGWTAIQRKNISSYTEAFYNQWYVGEQNPIKLISSKAGYIKAPTIGSLANQAPNSGGTIVLTKQRLITRFKSDIFSTLNQDTEDQYINPGYSSSRDYVIKGMIGFPGDEDYLKILLDAGTYRLQQIHLPHSMLDVKIQLLDPRIEVPKNKNGLNTSSIKSECAKISEYPKSIYGSHECFGLDKTAAETYGSSGILIDSNPNEKSAAIEFQIKKRTFIYLKVCSRLGSSGSTNDYAADVGKYAIALIGADKKKVSNDLTYPSCYINWSLNPDPIAVPQRKLSRIKISQNGAVKDVAFYLQEIEDVTKGALITPRKFNTVVNGKLIDSTSSIGIKYIVDHYEYSLFGYPRDSGERFRLFAPSSKNAGKFAQVEFIAGGVYNPSESEAFSGWSDSGGFITNWSDVSVGANYTQPPSTSQEIPISAPTPTPTPVCRVRECTGDQNDAPANCGYETDGNGYAKDLSFNCPTCKCTCKYRECTGNSSDPSMECWRYGFPGDYEASCSDPDKPIGQQGFCGCKKVSS
jgi:hypothetical protein